MSTTANSTVPATGNSTYYCQETFYSNSTPTCMRFPKLEHCIAAGDAELLNFYCVERYTLTINASGPSPLPSGLNMTAFNCTMYSCPIEAPPMNYTKPAHNSTNSTKQPKTKPTSQQTTSGAFNSNDKKLTLSGFFVLALMVSQLALIFEDNVRLQEGCLGFSLAQRRWIKASINGEVEVQPYYPGMDGSEVYISTVEVEVGLMIKDDFHIEIDTMEVERAFINVFNNQVLSTDQELVLDVEN
ncbi:hypothetical protein BGZ46_001258, partial [Entomortierella lignicola]